MNWELWRSMTMEERNKYLQERGLVYYLGHFIALEIWVGREEEIKREIKRKHGWRV